MDISLALLGVAAILFFVYFLYYYRIVSQETKLVYNLVNESGTTTVIHQVLHRCKHVREFTPPFFLIHRHLQTLGTKFLRSRPNLVYKREVVTFVDGGEVCLDWEINSYSSDENCSSPIVIILHGVVGSSKSIYMQQIALYMKKQGWRPVILNARGAGDTHLKNARPYHAASTEDLRHVVLYLRNQYPKAPLMATGYSMGANILTKYLGEEGSNAPLAAAISICNVFDFMECNKLSSKSLNCRFYNFFLTIDMKNYLKRHNEVLKSAVDVEEIIKSTQYLAEIDSKCVVKIFGFKSVEDYYEQASCSPYVKRVKIPMLFLNALDDPIMPPHAIPLDAVEHNYNIAFALTKRGGHIGYLKHFKFWQESWSDEVAVEFLSSALEVLSEKLQLQNEHENSNVQNVLTCE